MKFKEWLIIHEASLLIGTEEVEKLIAEGRFGDFIQRNKRRLIAPMLAAGIWGGFGGGNYHTSQPQEIRQNQGHQELIAAIQDRYNVKIDPSQIKIMKPSDAIATVYGKDWGKVKRDLQQARGPQVSQGIEIPPMNEPYTMNVDDFDAPTLVIYDNPESYGQKGGGFCANIVVGNKSQKFCVVRKDDDGYLTRHELSHTTQNRTLSDKKAGSFYDSYLSDPHEIAVRVAEMKRNYYKATGKIVNKSTLGDMIKHFYANPNAYSKDVRQLRSLFDEAKKRGELPQVINNIRDNIIDKVASSQRLGNLA